jgi:hypothetical protein
MALVGSISGSNGIVYASGSVNPAVDNAYSLGATGAKWSTVLATALSGSLTKLADGTSFLIAGDNVTITTGSSGAVTISSTGGGGGGGDRAAQYLVLALTTSLDNERAFTAGTGISTTDAGAGGNFTVAINNSVVATLTGSAFSGPITGTSLSMTGNVTGSNFLVSGDEITATAPVRINLGNTAATVNIGQSGTGNALNVRGNLDVDGTADIAGAITLSGNGQTVTHTGASGNLTIVSNNGNVVIESTTFNGNDVTIPGNLTVNGTVMSVASDNLKVKDSVLLLGSGSTTSNAKAAIAFVSGSSVANRAVIFGTVGGSDTSAVATMDVQDGTLPATNLDFTVLAPMRASKFELGAGGTAFITSSQGNNLTLQSSTALTIQSTGNKIFLSPATAGGGSVEFQYAGSAFAEFTGSLNNAVFGATLGKTMAISGSRVELNAGNGGTRFQVNGAQLGAVQGQASNSMSLTSFSTDFAARSLILSGSDLVVGANTANSNGVTFRIGATDYAQFNNVSTDAKFGAIGRRMMISGSQIKLNAQTPAGGGVQFEADGNAFLTIMSGTGPGVVIIGAAGGMLSAQLLNTDVTTVDFAGAATALNVGATSGTTTVRNSLQVNGNTTLGSDAGDDITFTGLAASNLLPKTDSFYNLGSPSARWANIYTGDLHLRNDRGNWTIIEEAEYLTITNNLNGKRFKFVLEEL